MKFAVIITLKKDVLDPQGKVIAQTLEGMGVNKLKNLRQGKYIEIDIQSNDYEKTKKDINLMCERLLANTIIEDFEIELV